MGICDSLQENLTVGKCIHILVAGVIIEMIHYELRLFSREVEIDMGVEKH